MPEKWRALGFTGEIWTHSKIQAEMVEWWKEVVPARLPLNTAGPWLALSVQPDDLTVLMVRLAEAEPQSVDQQ